MSGYDWGLVKKPEVHFSKFEWVTVAYETRVAYVPGGWVLETVHRDDDSGSVSVALTFIPEPVS